MVTRVDSAAKIASLDAVQMENDWLSIGILPDVGAKIYDLIWKPTGRNFLWHNPRIVPQTYPIEGNFDNYWCGGWDDGFPTADPCEFQGESYPNLGELRSLRWHVETAERRPGCGVVRLSAYGPISPVRAEKTIELADGSPVLSVDYEITNIGTMPLDFIWGTHPALAANQDTILRIPARTGIVGLSSDARFGVPGQRYEWPLVETPAGQTDVSRVQSIDAKAYCGHYATDLEAGWYAVEDTATGEGLLLQFPVCDCPHLWMWLVYGGWRGYHHVIVEPWTSYPVNLAEAARSGTSRRLEPGENFRAKIRATVYGREETWQGALRRVEQSCPGRTKQAS
jgi:galactose mutarotase-like enzyme